MSKLIHSFIHVVAAVIVKDKKLLCAQRNNTKYLAYKWEFPGGKIELVDELPQCLEHNEILWLDKDKLQQLDWLRLICLLLIF